MSIDIQKIEQQCQRLRAATGPSGVVPRGEYRGRIVAVEKSEDRWGRTGSRASFQIEVGDYAGRRIASNLHGVTEERLLAPGWRAREVVFRVYVRRHDDGREYSNVDPETVREVGADSLVLSDLSVAATSLEEVVQAADQFVIGFACVGSIGTKRMPVDWGEFWTSMATSAGSVKEPVFASTYVFGQDLIDHIAANDRRDGLDGSKPRGSMEGFRGPHYSPLISFDIDSRNHGGDADPEQAQESAIRLVMTLLEVGVPVDRILIFFSGRKGFHVQFPSSIAGALPSTRFAETAGTFCLRLANRAGIEIDESMYRILQPLRAPNSWNEGSGLYKVRLGIEEVIDMSIDDIKDLSRSPRPFRPPSFDAEPLPAIADLWRQSGSSGRPQSTQDASYRRPGSEEPRLFRDTWHFIVNGAEPGTRATELFKAAANLMDFGTMDALVRALLQRPAELSGLTPLEALGHIDGAIRQRVPAKAALGLKNQQ